MKIYSTWKEALKNRSTRILTCSAIASVFLALIVIRTFLIFNESRVGFAFQDPFLSLFRARDITWIIFFTIHIFLIWGVYLILHDPRKSIVWAHAYAIMVMFRVLGLYLLPLQPPLDMIFMHDPVVSTFTGTVTPVRDLFFSGHTATSFLLFLELRNTKWGWMFLAGSFCLGTCVLLQHVHYSIDVFAAPFFAYTSYKLSCVLVRKLRHLIR